MAFIRIRGIKGLVFMPDENLNKPRKRNCKDCYDCQMCSDERCDVCVKSRSRRNNKCFSKKVNHAPPIRRRLLFRLKPAKVRHQF